MYLDALVNIERIADQRSNIGVHTVALHDDRVAEMQHNYKHLLHKGGSDLYNERYKKAYVDYYTRLKAIADAAV